MTKTEINMINTTSLAYLGDAVYEVIVREMILAKYPLDAGKAHRHAVRYVSAGGQAKAARAMIEKGFVKMTIPEKPKSQKQRFLRSKNPGNKRSLL